MKNGEITVSQIELMKHATGFDENRVTGIKHRVMHAYRNYFYEPKNEEWEDLVNRGLARKSAGNNFEGFCYELTLEGFKFLGDLCGMQIVEIH